jgi:hypothetical protein
VAGRAASRAGRSAEIKSELDAAAFTGTGVHDVAGQTLACRALISSAERLAAGH